MSVWRVILSLTAVSVPAGREEAARTDCKTVGESQCMVSSTTLSIRGTLDGSRSGPSGASTSDFASQLQTLIWRMREKRPRISKRGFVPLNSHHEISSLSRQAR